MAKKCKKNELALTLTEARQRTVFAFIGIIAVISSSCASARSVRSVGPSTTYSTLASLSSATAEQASPVDTASQDIILTPSELQEFDSIMLELDPDQQLVTKITQQELSTTVNVTIGPGFMSLSQERKNEVAMAMHDGLSQVCLCSPHLAFNTETGEPLAKIDR